MLPLLYDHLTLIKIASLFSKLNEKGNSLDLVVSISLIINWIISFLHIFKDRLGRFQNFKTCVIHTVFFKTPNLKYPKPYALADPGTRPIPSLSKFLHFHAVFSKNLQNNRFGSWCSPQENPRSTTVTYS